MLKKIAWALAFGALIFVVVIYRQPLAGFLSDFTAKTYYIVSSQLSLLSPCSKPLVYSLGAIDPRFDISESEVSALLEQASAAWSDSIGRPLFEVASSGGIVVNLTYDYRQEASDKLKTLGIAVTSDRQSYDQLKAKYDATNQLYMSKKSELDRLSAELKIKQTAYEAEVKEWNQRGGAPEKEYDRLNSLRDALNAEVARINALANEVNRIASELNAEGIVMNKLIGQLNLNVGRYNNVGAEIGEEFQEGVYEQGPDGKSITVFEFDSHNQLLRLLVHEFGHALNLAHTSSSGDVMYYLNQGDSHLPTAGDVKALKTVCAISD